MNKLTKRNEQGFTIIEVVLVLAIAGLIFLVVFLALPQLQRSRRDNQRKSDAGRIVAALENYASNNNGTYPAEATANNAANFGTYGAGNAFWDSYANTDGNLQDPSTGNYSISFPAGTVAATTTNEGDVHYWLGRDCDDGTNARSVAIRVGVEQGSYCQDNR